MSSKGVCSPDRGAVAERLRGMNTMVCPKTEGKWQPNFRTVSILICLSGNCYYCSVWKSSLNSGVVACPMYPNENT